MSHKKIRIGTRGSKLALYQAEKVRDKIRETHPGINTEIVIIKTMGDKILDVALSKIGDKGLFTKELEKALTDNRIDMAVHSLKDLPTELPVGYSIGAVLERGDYRDAIVSVKNKKLSDLDAGDRRVFFITTTSFRWWI